MFSVETFILYLMLHIYFWWMTASFDNLLWTHIFQLVGSIFLDPGRVLKDYFIDRELQYSRLAWLHLPNEDPFLVRILRILKFVKPSEVWLKCFTSRIPIWYKEQMFFEIMCWCRNYTNTSGLQYWFYADRNWIVLSTIYILDTSAFNRQRNRHPLTTLLFK